MEEKTKLHSLIRHSFIPDEHFHRKLKGLDTTPFLLFFQEKEKVVGSYWLALQHRTECF